MTMAATVTYTQRNPFLAPRTSSYRITPAGSAKDTKHHVISLAGSGMTYRPGDSLGVCPRNPEPLVEAILQRLGASGSEPVTIAQGPELTFREALTTKFDLSNPSKRLLEGCVAKGAENLRPLVEKGGEEQFKHYVHAWDDVHDVLDVLNDAPGIQFTAGEFVGLMRALQPRLYSVSSSLLRHPDEAHLLVLSVTYDVRGRERLGVCSTFINDRWPEGEKAPIYLQSAQKHFALPTDPSTPMIMVGPGTGLAPFRAFLEEREETGAKGRNWLFFGEQSAKWGFYYGEELTEWQRRGFLRLDLAFSRDQAFKIYVQHRMHEHARDIYAWLEDGAELFVCGDKGKMAADVQNELLSIIQTQGGRTAEQAAEYVANLKKSHRLKLDVY